MYCVVSEQLYSATHSI